MKLQRFARALALVSFLTIPAMAATFVVPDDETFIRKADVIVTGTVLDSHVRYADGGGIETIYRIAVDEVLKGALEEPIVEIREWGGVIGSQWMAASGAPHYDLGQRYLIFMSPFRDGTLTTLDFALGQFQFVEYQGQMILERDHRGIIDLSERPLPFERPAKQFLEVIRDQVGQDQVRSADSRTIVVAPTANNLDHVTAINKGVGQWSSGSTVNYSFSGTPASSNVKDPFDGVSKIIIDDPNGDITGVFTGSGTLAIAFFGGGSAGDHLNITGADIVVQDGVGSSTGVSQATYNTMMTHELGHTLGFRHSNQDKFSTANTSCDAGFPCSSSAVMFSNALGSFNGNLQSWDQDAKQANYASSSSMDADYLTHHLGDGRAWHRDNPSASWSLSAPLVCTGPSITAQPTANPLTITSGQSSTLSVTATAGEGSLSYQWYRGSRGVTNSPAGTGASVSVSPTVSSSYWVRVTDGCSSVDSSTVTVTVQVGCTGPSVPQPIANPSTINQGGSSTLSVSASASEGSLTYQWYIGSSGQTSNPISGATGSSVSVSPTITTNYWVRVTDGCDGGTARNSNTVTVTVCIPPAITVQPQDTSVESGKSVTLSTSASGTSPVIRWYRGNVGDTSNLLTTSSSVTVSPTTDTKYWARASNSCGSADTRQVTVVVVGQCEAPQITQQPQPATIQAGETATLTVGATGTTLSHQWFEVRGGGTEFVPIPGANAASYTTPPLAASTAYLVQITNSCGLVNSNQVLVTVSQCNAPAITSQPQSESARGGQRVILRVTATGTGPLSYQWFEGQSGTPSRAINGATSATLQITASETKSYWVRVRNDCGEVNSETATVTVEPSRRRSVRRP